MGAHKYDALGRAAKQFEIPEKEKSKDLKIFLTFITYGRVGVILMGDIRIFP